MAQTRRASLDDLIPACARTVFDIIRPPTVEDARVQFAELDSASARLTALVERSCHCYAAGEDWLHAAQTVVRLVRNEATRLDLDQDAVRHRALALDWRGHGGSEPAATDFGETELAAQQRYAAAHPWLEVCRLDARSHFPMFETPDELQATIDEFAASAFVVDDLVRG